MSIDPKSLKLFTSVVKFGTIAAAADHEHIAAAAVSRRISDLEDVLESTAQQYASQAQSHDKVWLMMLNSGAIVAVGCVVLLLFGTVYGPMLYGGIGTG